MPLFASDAHLASAISNRAIFALQAIFFNGPLGCPQATGPKATEGGIL